MVSKRRSSHYAENGQELTKNRQEKDARNKKAPDLAARGFPFRLLLRFPFFRRSDRREIAGILRMACGPIDNHAGMGGTGVN